MTLRPDPRLPTASCILITILVSAAFAGNCPAEVVIAPREKWSNVFADQKLTLSFAAEAKQAFDGRVVWSFAASNGRIFPGGRGETFVKLAAGKSTEVKVPLQMPPVKPGVVLPAVLTISAVSKDRSEPEGTLERKLWIFPDDPFVDRGEWLKKLEITVFDPTRDARTIKLLTRLEIPHEEIRNLAALGELDKGLLLIGEGVSFRDERGLDEVLVKLARKGVPVLCLAPHEGLIALPGTGEDGPLPTAVHWRNQNIITELDKHLDAQAWAGTPAVVASSLRIKADEGRVVGEVVAGTGGWPWLGVSYADRGKLLVVGFPVIGQWSSSPTPRYLFARLLEHVSKEPQTAEERKAPQ